jgi:hypothetical protein
MAGQPSTRLGANGDHLSAEDWVDQRYNELERATAFLNGNELAKRVSGQVLRQTMQPIGAARSVWNTGKGLLDVADFADRLLDPLSPSGQAAWGDLYGAGEEALRFGREAVSDPKAAGRDIGHAGRQFYESIEPSATPMASTFTGEMRRMGNIGANQGEATADIASLLGGGIGVKGVAKIGAAKALTKADYLRAGFTEKQIAGLGKAYAGRGHHAIPLRATKGLSESVRNNPAFVLDFKGRTRAQANEEHFRVDKKFWGANAPKDPGGPRGWSGKKLGLERYGPINRLAFGTPDLVKNILIGNALGVLVDMTTGGDNGAPKAQKVR